MFVTASERGLDQRLETLRGLETIRIGPIGVEKGSEGSDWYATSPEHPLHLCAIWLARNAGPTNQCSGLKNDFLGPMHLSFIDRVRVFGFLGLNPKLAAYLFTIFRHQMWRRWSNQERF